MGWRTASRRWWSRARRCRSRDRCARHRPLSIRDHRPQTMSFLAMPNHRFGKNLAKAVTLGPKTLRAALVIGVDPMLAYTGPIQVRTKHYSARTPVPAFAFRSQHRVRARRPAAGGRADDRGRTDGGHRDIDRRGPTHVEGDPPRFQQPS